MTTFPQKTISFDLDNVIRDQIGSIIKAVYRRYGVKLTRQMFNQWDPPLGHLVQEDDEMFTRWAWGCPMIFAESRPVPGVVAAMTKLAKNNRILITTVTACPDLTGPWLRWWNIPYHTIIHTKDKGSVMFDWHLDDSPTTLRSLSEQGRQVVRVWLPWNQELNWLPTLKNWNKAQEFLQC